MEHLRIVINIIKYVKKAETFNIMVHKIADISEKEQLTIGIIFFDDEKWQSEKNFQAS